MRHLAAVLIASVLGAGLSLGVAPVQASPYCDPYGDPSVYQACLALQRSQRQQAANRAQLASVEAEEASTAQAIIDLQNLLAQLQSEINAQEAAIADTEAKIAVLNAKIAALDAEIAREQAYIDQREALLARRVRTIDEHGQVDYFVLIVTATSFTDLVDRVVTVQEIVHSDHNLIEQLQAARALVQSERDQQAQARDALDALLGEQKQQEAVLADTQAQQQQALAYEHQHEAELQAYQAQLEADQQALNNQVQQDQQAYAAAAAAAGGGSGRFSWPETPGTFQITQGFGCTDYNLEPWGPNCPPQAHYFHYGIDIAGPYGANVYAADTGIASLYYDSSGYGLHIVITHGNGWSTLYGHLSQFDVSDGQTVTRGQVIAQEGSTGNSSGPHLHFGVELNGGWVNPCDYLVPSC